MGPPCAAQAAAASELDPRLLRIARDIRRQGGTALLVGGYVRDRLLGQRSKDVDVEVFGLDLDALRRVLARHGEVLEVGRAFGVLRVKGLDVDIALPRADSRPGDAGIAVRVDAGLDFAAAARRRDLTINSIGLDPLSGDYIDPHGGRDDLRRGVLRATDPRYFVEDPLRGLRVAQIAARFALRPEPALTALCRGLDLGDVAPERIFQEFRKLLLRASRPSLGLAFLLHSELLRFFPALHAMVGVSQDPRWHPEGDVWVHTLMVVDEAAGMKRQQPDDEVLMFAALCHDLGKPLTTEIGETIRSPGHDVAGMAPTRALLEGMRAPHHLVQAVEALVRHHLAPALFVAGGAGPRAYRRLARALGRADTSMCMLARVARSDHLGRTTGDALARRFPAGDAFLAQAAACRVSEAPRRDAVMGRHLIDRGISPGPEMGALLARCREIQDETGQEDPAAILDVVLADRAGTGP